MSNGFYNHSSGLPVSNSRGLSSSVRGELDLVEDGFDAVETNLATKLDTATAVSDYLTQSDAASTYLSQSDAATEYLTQADAATDYAPLVSPAFTGTPTAPTATAGTSTSQVATTAFVSAASFSSALPAQAGNSGKFVTTDGNNASWASQFPDQTSNSGKFLTTNGTTASWGTVTPAPIGTVAYTSIAPGVDWLPANGAQLIAEDYPSLAADISYKPLRSYKRIANAVITGGNKMLCNSRRSATLAVFATNNSTTDAYYGSDTAAFTAIPGGSTVAAYKWPCANAGYWMCVGHTGTTIYVGYSAAATPASFNWGTSLPTYSWTALLFASMANDRFFIGATDSNNHKRLMTATVPNSWSETAGTGLAHAINQPLKYMVEWDGTLYGGSGIQLTGGTHQNIYVGTANRNEFRARLSTSNTAATIAFGMTGDGASTLVGTNSESTTIKSTNGGVTWAAGGTYSVSGAVGIGYVNGVYVINGAGQYSKSTDAGATWSGAVGSHANATHTPINLGGRLVWAGYDLVSHTTDGSTFTASRSPMTSMSTTYAASDGAGKVIFVGFNGAYWLSTDHGATWTVRYQPGGATNSGLAAYANGLFFMFSRTATTTFYSSTDGITWTQRTWPGSFQCSGVAYGAGVYVFITDAASTTSYSSADLSTFNANTMSVSAAVSIAFNGSVFAVTASGAGTAAQFSSNGTSWTTASGVFASNTWKMSAANGILFAHTNGGAAYLYTSTNGSVWTQRTLPDGAQIDLVIYSGSTYYAVGNTRLSSSSDYITWSTVHSDSSFTAASQLGNTTAFTGTHVASYASTGTTFARQTLASGAYLDVYFMGNNTSVTPVSMRMSNGILLVGANCCYTTTDGLAWNVSKPYSVSGRTVTAVDNYLIGFFDGTYYYAGSLASSGVNKVYRSADMMTWSEIDPVDTLGMTQANNGQTRAFPHPDGGAVVYGPKLQNYDESGNQPYFWAKDGYTRILNMYPASSGSLVDSGKVTYFNGRYYIPCDKYYVSTDLTDTYFHAFVDDVQLGSVSKPDQILSVTRFFTFNGRLFGIHTSGTACSYMYSDDGRTWTQARLPCPIAVSGTGFSNYYQSDQFAVCTKFMAVIDTVNKGGVYISTDGLTWSALREASDSGTSGSLEISNDGTADYILMQRNEATEYLYRIALVDNVLQLPNLSPQAYIKVA